jgi:hypothetical protein
VSADLSTPGAQYLYLQGDQTAIPFWLGMPFTFTWDIGRVLVREANARGASKGILTGRTAVLRGNVALKGSGFASATVTHAYNDPDVYTWQGLHIGSSSIFVSEATVLDDVFSFPVMGRSEDVSIKIESSSYLPLAITGAEWEVDYSSKSTRYRGS